MRVPSFIANAFNGLTAMSRGQDSVESRSCITKASTPRALWTLTADLSCAFLWVKRGPERTAHRLAKRSFWSHRSRPLPPTFAEVLGVKRQAVSGQSLQQQLVAGPPTRLGDGGGHALHGRHALEESRLAVEADEFVELGQDAVALDLLLLRQLQLYRDN